MAFPSSQSVIDFNEIATSYNSLKYNVQGGPRVNDAKLTQITLKAREVKWNPDKMSPIEDIREPRTRQASHSTVTTMTETANVNIQKGLCKGLNTKVNVPFPGVQGGSHVLNIDPCDQNQYKEYKTPVQFTSAARGSGAHVEEVLQKQEYDGHFECRVYPGGSILLEGQSGQADAYGQVKTQSVIGYLKDRGSSSVKDFGTDDEGKYFFTMRSHCVLHLDAQLQHNWP